MTHNFENTPQGSSSLYTRLASGVMFPLHERLKRHSTSQVFSDMERSQWLPPDELKALQVERLRGFLVAIGTHVPFYRKLFATLGFNPGEVESISDLQKLPFSVKTTIRENREALVSDSAGPLQRFNTGGSSGEPLVFFLGRERVSHDVAAKWRATRWWSVDIGDPEIVLWGSPIELRAQDRLRLWRDRLLRTELLSAFEMTPGNMRRFVERIRDVRPKMLFGYPSSFSLLCEYAHREGYRLDDLGTSVVFVTSETLYDYQREVIEKAFACPVANGYGGRDAGFIAHQCPAGAMHITAEDIVVEIIRPDGSPAGPDESGEIVVTHMATSEFPFVRYRTGDIGRLDETPCSCGRGLPVLAEIQGRSTDFIVASNGAVMHGLALIYVLRDLPEVGEFRIIQHSLEELEIKLVPAHGWSEEIAEDIRKAMRRRLGKSVQVEIECLASIPGETSGKRRYVISKVDPAVANTL